MSWAEPSSSHHCLPDDDRAGARHRRRRGGHGMSAAGHPAGSPSTGAPRTCAPGPCPTRTRCWPRPVRQGHGPPRPPRVRTRPPRPRRPHGSGTRKPRSSPAAWSARRQGWTEAPYAATPCRPLDLQPVAAPARDPRLRLRLIPGVKQAEPPRRHAGRGDADRRLPRPQPRLRRRPLPARHPHEMGPRDQRRRGHRLPQLHDRRALRNPRTTHGSPPLRRVGLGRRGLRRRRLRTLSRPERWPRTSSRSAPTASSAGPTRTPPTPASRAS
jgi:hypothetical protein